MRRRSYKRCCRTAPLSKTCQASETSTQDTLGVRDSASNFAETLHRRVRLRKQLVSTRLVQSVLKLGKIENKAPQHPIRRIRRRASSIPHIWYLGAILRRML